MQALQPTAIVPFSIDRDTATNILRKHYARHKDLPSSFADDQSISCVRSAYVPFWHYELSVLGDVELDGETEQLWEDASYRYKRINYYELRRAGVMSFAHLPVCACSSIEREYLEAVEPYDYADLQSIESADGLDCPVLIADLDAKTCREIAQNRAEKSFDAAIRQSVSSAFLRVHAREQRHGFEWQEACLVLQPVWLHVTKWDGKEFVTAINGQTGAVWGDLPIDRKKLARRSMKISAVLLAALLLMLWVF